MKIGILTFHWATNYGAILQAFALQCQLELMGHEPIIIDYVPKHRASILRKLFLAIRSRKWSELVALGKSIRKEKALAPFRKRYIKSSLPYHSLTDLRKTPPIHDAYICGSDQIWNYHYLLGGEGKYTPSYFLDFGAPTVKRIAYAVSFGTDIYPSQALNYLPPLLERFHAISVRERSGITIVNAADRTQCELVPDPSLLLSKDDYQKRLGLDLRPRDHVYFYVLQKDQKRIEELRKHCQDHDNHVIDSSEENEATVERWLESIGSARLVITNSFHGIAFSVILRVPFVAILVEGSGSGMNDRVLTLLRCLGLEDRIWEGGISNFESLSTRTIDWESTETHLQAMIKEGRTFLETSLA